MLKKLKKIQIKNIKKTHIIIAVLLVAVIVLSCFTIYFSQFYRQQRKREEIEALYDWSQYKKSYFGDPRNYSAIYPHMIIFKGGGLSALIEFTYNEERSNNWENWEMSAEATEMALESWVERFDPVYEPSRIRYKDWPKHQAARMQVYTYLTTGGLPAADGTTVWYDDIYYSLSPPEIVVDDEMWAEYFRGAMLELESDASYYYRELGGGHDDGLVYDMFETAIWRVP